MRRLAILLLAALLLARPALAHDGPVQSSDLPEQGGLFVNLTSDDPFRAWMALHFALTTKRLGYPVTVFLNVIGVRLASTAQPAPKFAQAIWPPLDYLRAIMKEGGTVLTCTPCMTEVGMKMSDVLEGLLPGAPGLTQAALFAANVRVLSW